MSELTVLSSDAYTVESGDIEEYTNADVDGTLEVNGTLRLVDDPVDPSNNLGTGPLDLPLAPLNLSSMELGLGFFLVGIMALLGGAGAVLKNYAALLMWSLAFVALIASGVLGIGLELYWVLVIATILVLMLGVAVKASR